MFNSRLRTAAKILFAAMVIGAVLTLAGRSIAPGIPLGRWVFWCALGLAAFVVVSFLRALLDLEVLQWVLRKGGGTWMDRWFWADSLRQDAAHNGQESSTDKPARD